MSPPRGRPRSPEVDDALRRAAHDSLLRHGYAGTSVEGVATSANVAKTTLYRRWPSKAEMVFALVVHGNAIAPPTDTGSLRGDLTALSERVIGLLSGPAARQAFPGLVADLAADSALAARFRHAVIDRQRDLVQVLLNRAAARGEVVAALNANDAHAQLLGTVFAWLYLTADTMPVDLATRIGSAITAAVAPSVEVR